ncbi:MAG TPA: ABC transporter substrate-binding protein [Chloroflexota bacterium]|jgi:peptide/nickel transport system substrate-binding protein
MRTLAPLCRSLLLVALASALVLVACGSKEPARSSQSPSSGQDQAQQAARPTEWNVVIPEQTGGADPISEYGTNSQYQLPLHVLEPLMHIEMLRDGSAWGVVNDLAEKWSFPNPTTLEVALKQGIQFQNGEELTAEHVKYAYDAIVFAEKPGRRAVSLKVLGDAEIVDKYTIRWHMPAPNSTVLGSLYTLLIPPLARRSMTAEEFEAKPIGTGPYKVVDWPRDGTVRLEAWDGYRKGKAFPERLTIRTVPEPSTRVLEVLAGTAQIAQTVPIEALGSVESNPQKEVVSLKGNSSLSYVINVFKTTPPLRDQRVRQAMNYAVDRDAIVKSVLGGRGTSLPGPLWPGWLGYDGSVAPYPYDPEKARALLREAGYPDGFAMKWSVTQGIFVKDVEIAQAVANQLAKVGIQVQLQPLERARLLAERNEGDFDMTELAWPNSWIPVNLFAFTLGASYPDAKLTPRWGATPDSLAEARKLVQDAGAASSVDQMAVQYGQLARLVHDQAFWLFVHTTDDLWATQKDIAWRPYPTNYVVFYDYWKMVGVQAPRDPAVPPVRK